MKIVQICRLYAPHIGGVETHVSAVNELLIKTGHTVSVLTTQHDQQLPLTEKVNGVTIIRQPYTDREGKLNTWQWIWRQRAVLEAADIIQVHDVFWWLWPWAVLHRKKMYCTYHGWETCYPVRWQAKLHRLVASWFVQGSIHIGQWIQEFYWDKPTAVTYGGLTEKIITIGKKQSLTTTLKQIVFVGRLETDNDLEKAILLVQALKQEYKDLAVTWVGDGRMARECARQGEVTGWVVDPEKYVAKADLVLASSYLSILQAQGMGKVVSAFYSNRLKQRYLETYPGCPYLLMTDSVQQTVRNIIKLFSNQTQLQLLEKEARNFAQTQTWAKVVEVYLHLWQQGR